MKPLLLILLPFFSFAQATTYEPGDSTWITSSDTGKVKVYKITDVLKTLETSGSCLVAHPKIILPANPLKSIEAPIRCLFIPDKKIITDTADPSFIDSKTTRWREKPKYDTLPPVWKQVSDTTPGYNPVMAMQLYEVRVYKNEWITDLQPIDGGYYDNGKKLQAIPYHLKWLDIHKKPFKLKVW